jgi:hypothetical protein
MKAREESVVMYGMVKPRQGRRPERVRTLYSRLPLNRCPSMDRPAHGLWSSFGGPQGYGASGVWFKRESTVLA